LLLLIEQETKIEGKLVGGFDWMVWVYQMKPSMYPGVLVVPWLL